MARAKRLTGKEAIELMTGGDEERKRELVRILKQVDKELKDEKEKEKKIES